MHYNHIILTRFNLQYERGSTTHLDAEWLEERFRLFDSYCLPSITKQTCQDFTWVILVSDQTPDVYKERLNGYTIEHANIAIHFCPYYEDINQLYHEIGHHYGLGYSHLLSTRLDSDDMLAFDFVEKIQSHIAQPTKSHTIFSFQSGIQWFENSDISLAASYTKNHFLSFYEPVEQIRTCIGINHTEVPDDLLVSLEEKGMWCEIVHRHNMCNSYVPKYKYRLSIPVKQYPISLDNASVIAQCKLLILEHLSFRFRQIGRLTSRLLLGHNS